MKHIMIDLEMNKIKKQYREDKKLSNELIEIGAVMRLTGIRPM